MQNFLHNINILNPYPAGYFINVHALEAFFLIYEIANFLGSVVLNYFFRQNHLILDSYQCHSHQNRRNPASKLATKSFKIMVKCGRNCQKRHFLVVFLFKSHDLPVKPII